MTETATPSHVSPIASPNLIPTASPDSPSGLIPITSGPYFTLTREANCYTGPGVGYNFVLILHAGESVAVIDRNPESTWWRISPDPDTVVYCWVADQWGTFTGEAASVPIISSQYATQAVTPISPTQTKKNQVEEPTSVPLSTPLPQPTNPPTNPPPTQPPLTTEPPTPTEPPPTEPPSTEPPPTEPPTPTKPPICPPICLPLP